MKTERSKRTEIPGKEFQINRENTEEEIVQEKIQEYIICIIEGNEFPD